MSYPLTPSFLAQQRVLVLGAGLSGLAMAKWCLRNGAQIVLSDTRSLGDEWLSEQQWLKSYLEKGQARTVFPKTAGAFSNELLPFLPQCTVLAISPGLSLWRGEAIPLLQQAKVLGIAVVGELHFFAAALWHAQQTRSYTPKVVAISGTNGKTTTTRLTAYLANAAGISAVAAGNINPALLDALMQALDDENLPQLWVLELSSFQLAVLDAAWNTPDYARLFRPNAAVVLNITDDHLDWHRDMVDYQAAKLNLFNADNTVCVANLEDEALLPLIQKKIGVNKKIYGYSPRQQNSQQAFGLSETVNNPYLQGMHNMGNVMAAMALLASVGCAQNDLLAAIPSFENDAHRLQVIAEYDGICFIDDSKATNVGATLAAIEAVSVSHALPFSLILGGDGKGQDFIPLAKALAGNTYVQQLILLGKDANIIAQALRDNHVMAQIVFCQDLSQGVAMAYSYAKGLISKGLIQKERARYAVVLSPACASLDMFRNYAHRAEVFAQAVVQQHDRETA